MSKVKDKVAKNNQINMMYIYLLVNEEEETSEAMSLRMCLLKLL